MHQQRRKDRHADAQIAYRVHLKEKKAPDREDFGRAALVLILLNFDHKPQSNLAKWLYEALTSELTQDGFDEYEVKKRFSDMADRVHDYRKAREYIRCWRQVQEAENAS